MGEVLAGLVALGVGRLLHKAYHSLDDDYKLARESYHNMRRSDSMAMLVHWCYYRDLTLLEEVVAWFLEYNNDRATYYGDNYWMPHPCGERYMGELKNLGLAFLRRRSTHSNPNAPDLVIVLRGTIPTRVEDLEADWKIAIQQFDHTDRVVRISELILQVVKKFRRDYPGKQICMAGHSLGAAIALIVGGCLYSTHKIGIETHLFNPPLLTLFDVARGLPQPTAPSPYCMMNVDFSKLKEVLVVNNAAVHKEWEQFQRLQHWVPRIYLNPGDPICRQFIAFYKSREGRPIGSPGDLISSQGLLSGLFSNNVKNFKNVVPSAQLCISTWEAKPKPHARFAGPFKDVVAGRLPHSLRQWHKYTKEYIGLTEHRARLLQQPYSPEPTVHPRIVDYSYLFQ